jgi:hypothetical protein
MHRSRLIRVHNGRSNDILTSTKILILKEIELTGQFELGAEAIVNANLQYVLVRLLEFPDMQLLHLTCSILTQGGYESIT